MHSHQNAFSEIFLLVRLMYFPRLADRDHDHCTERRKTYEEVNISLTSKTSQMNCAHPSCCTESDPRGGLFMQISAMPEAALGLRTDCGAPCRLSHVGGAPAMNRFRL